MHEFVLSFFLFFRFECHCLSLGTKSNKQEMSPPRVLDIPLSPSAKLITCLEDWKNLKSTTIPKICSLRTSSMPSGLSTTPLSNGPTKPALGTFPSEEHFIRHAKSKRTRCSSLEAATPATNATTILITSSCVILKTLSRLPMAPASQSKVSRPS